jgi:hypothetical protein
MAVLHDYKCPTHGYFEAWDDAPSCPKGACKGVLQVYLKPPGIKGERTKRADRALNNLASEFQMTDIKSTREGEHQSGYHTRNNAPAPEPRPGDSVIWGGSNRFNMGAALAGQIAKPVRGEPVGIKPQEAGNLTGPKIGSYIADHENLKLNK